MSAPLAIFKCEFGGANGWGHVTRSGALAAAFGEAGWRTALWTSSDPDTLTPETAGSFQELALGASIPRAAREAEAVVVDEMYTPDADFAALRAAWPGSARFVGIDDMQRRSMGAFDLTINTEIGLRAARYASPRCLLGERYALLRRGFRTPLDVESEAPEGARPVFVMLGGTDAFGYTPRILECLAELDAKRFAPIVAMGAASVELDRVSDILARFSGGRLLERLESPELAGWLRRCEFGIIACGTSLYELAAIRLPFVGLSLVDNQAATARQVERQWRMPVLFRENRHEAPLDLRGALETVLARRAQLAGAAFAEVDAQGAQRAAEAIAERFGA